MLDASQVSGAAEKSARSTENADRHSAARAQSGAADGTGRRSAAESTARQRAQSHTVQAWSVILGSKEPVLTPVKRQVWSFS